MTAHFPHPGLVSITFRKLRPAEIIALASSAGLRSIEWGGDVHVPPGDLAVAREVGRSTTAAGLSVSAYGSYYCGPVSEAEGMSFASVVETAKALGTRVIRVWPGKEGTEQARANGTWDSVVEQLRRCGDLASKAGMTVGLEFHAKTLTDSQAAAEDLMAALDHPAVKLFWQPINGASLEVCKTCLQALLPHVIALHVFHWTFDEAGQKTIHPLQTGEGIWQEYLALARQSPDIAHASLEFVRDGEPAQMAEDAAVLHRLLAC